MALILETGRTPDVLREIGARLRRTRLQQNLKIEDLATRAGVGVSTIQRLESGRSVGLEYLVRVLRGLGRLQSLNSFLPEPEVSPLKVAALGGSERRRASSPRSG